MTTPRPSPPIFAAAIAALALLATPLTGTAWGEAMWTTYHRDTGRSGYDSEAGESTTPTLDWQSPELDGDTWGQPLVLGERVYVATTGDEIYALEAPTGRVIWQKSAGEPVPSEVLPCGDIEPVVGFVGTPVIDTAADAIYAVADVWNASKHEAEHMLEGYRLSDGAQVLSTPVDPPGANPKAILQRTALTLDSGQIIFGFGGNDGDCSEYRGAVAAVPENGGKPRFWQYQPKAPAFSGGAIWGPSGPVVSGEGDIYLATGNPNAPVGQEVTEFDDSDSFLRLEPADLVSEPSSEPAPLGWFEPPSWMTDSNSDRDLGSAGPELLPGGILFQAGKNGTGYLLETAMHGASTAVYEGEVCNGAESFGGDAFANGVIYVACANGVQALSYDQSQRTFTPIWQGPHDAFGPPIVAGGEVWSVATRAFEGGGGTKLYGLEPATGVARYEETLPSPVTDHFASPSAAGGRLFVATGASVTAYQIANLGASTGPGSSEGTSSSGDQQVAGCTPSGPAGAGCTTSQQTGHAPGGSPRPAAHLSATPLLLHTHLHAMRDHVRVALRCPMTVRRCKGTLTLRAEIPVMSDGGRRVARVVQITLARARFGPSRGEFSIVLRLDRAAMARLRRHKNRLVLRVVIASPGSSTRLVAAVLTKRRES